VSQVARSAVDQQVTKRRVRRLSEVLKLLERWKGFGGQPGVELGKARTQVKRVNPRVLLGLSWIQFSHDDTFSKSAKRFGSSRMRGAFETLPRS
jgi:hypothetical protein